MLILLTEELHGLHTIGYVMKIVLNFALLERLQGEPGVTGIILYQQNLYRL